MSKNNISYAPTRARLLKAGFKYAVVNTEGVIVSVHKEMAYASRVVKLPQMVYCVKTGEQLI